MIYFCADDYGISEECNDHIEDCLEHGVLNKISILPNGEFSDFKQRLSGNQVKLSLHINLVEGYPLSEQKDVSLITAEQGHFKYSFAGLFLLSFSNKRKEFEKQLYKEIQKQIIFWKNSMGDAMPVSIDSHQHTHMIPLVFKTLMQVIKDENIEVECIRIPAEPVIPYILTPSLYSSYSLKGLIKQWILIVLAFVNRHERSTLQFDSPYFMGTMFSGQLTEEKIKRLLPRYLKTAQKHGKQIEIAFHPGYLENSRCLINGHQKSFEKFYFSKWRKKEYDTLMNLSLR